MLGLGLRLFSAELDRRPIRQHYRTDLKGKESTLWSFSELTDVLLVKVPHGEDAQERQAYCTKADFKLCG